MIRVKAYLSYEGTSFHGWQIQPNAVTVQGELQIALKKIFGEHVPTVGCSRTDAGVHAENFVCHMDLPWSFPLEKLPFALNALLPAGIAVHRAEFAEEGFHARFSCKGKTYRYCIHNARIRDPFLEKRAYFYPVSLDAERMNENAQAFVGSHDFAAFMASGSEMENTVRHMSECFVQRFGDLIEFQVTGNGFLYNMVRIMVGTLISSAAEKLVYSVPEILASKDRTLAGITVPPHGLYLKKVYY